MRCNKASETKVINCDSGGGMKTTAGSSETRGHGLLRAHLFLRPAEVGRSGLCCHAGPQCSSTGWRSLDQCHCRELLYKRSLMRESNFQERGFL